MEFCCAAAVEELKWHILKANEKGTFFPDDVIVIINKFLAANPISLEGFQIIYNVLPEETEGENEDPGGSQSSAADDAKVCLFNSCVMYWFVLIC